MKRIAVYAAFLLCCMLVVPDLNAQVSPEETDSPEVLPEFPGGDSGLQQYLCEHASIHLSSGSTGTVTVIGIVEEDGSLEHVAVLRGLYPAADEEALRLVRAMPLWKPGTINGKPVRTLMRIQVVF